MGRGPRCSKDGLNKGPWLEAEDKLLLDYIKNHGEGKWSNVTKETGLKRCGKSCRLRWMNYLRPDIKRGSISDDEEELIIRLHKLLGNRWSLIAGRLPGRTDNEIKNYWNSNLAKKMAQAAAAAAQTSPHQSKCNNNNAIVQRAPDQSQTPQQQPSNANSVIPSQPASLPVQNRTLDDFHNNVAMNNNTNQHGSLSTTTTMNTNTTGDGDDHLPTNFMMNFNTDDHEDFCKILDCDFGNLNNAIDGNEDDHQGSPVLVLPKQMMDKNMQAADFGSLASFLESEDWLGNDLNVILS